MRTAAYARYSSDSQREASIDDQLRNVRTFCTRQGWPEPTIYSDAAISGARTDRADYLRLLADAHKFDVLLVDDLSRFGRDKDEIGKTVKRLVFVGVRLVGVSDGVDTARKNHKADVGLRGLMSELYLDDLAEKTHRGLTGRALAGASAGGLPYGYRVIERGQRAIDAAQAAIVRRIFDDYLAGMTARQIAAGLNAEGLRSARGSTWAMTAIHGDVRRGIGILANPIYIGRQVWNRSRWVKHPESGRRVRQERPPSDWVTTEHPELAIIDQATWQRAQARLRGQHRATGQAGRPPRYLLSGILQCGECGGPMVVIDRYRYGCSTAKDRGTCTSTVRFARRDAELTLLAGVREQLLSEDAFQRFQRVANAELKHSAPQLETEKRKLAQAEQLRENILAALRAGIITPSTKAEMQNAEAAVASAQATVEAMRTIQPSTFLPRAREVWKRITGNLADYSRNVPAAREALRDMLGDRIVVTRNENGDPVAEITASNCQITVVAGAGFGRCLTGLTLRIPLTSGRAS